MFKKIFGSKVPIVLLEHFMTNPSSELHLSEVERKLKLSRASLVKWLKLLVRQDVLLLTEKGNLNLYRLNIENPAVKQLRIFYSVSKLLAHFKGMHGFELFLYGSTARGEDKEDSDIDLLVIGDNSSALNKTADELSEKLGREIKLHYCTQLDYSKLAKDDAPFYQRVEADKIRIV